MRAGKAAQKNVRFGVWLQRDIALVFARIAEEDCAFVREVLQK